MITGIKIIYQRDSLPNFPVRNVEVIYPSQELSEQVKIIPNFTGIQ